MEYSLTLPARVERQVTLPVSKSISNRAMIIAALAVCGLEEESGNSRSKELLSDDCLCDDIVVMWQALWGEGSSCDVSRKVAPCPHVSRARQYINIHGAGTAMRFLTAYFAIQDGRVVTLDGDDRMRERPIGVLVEALRRMGGEIAYLGREGYPPLCINGRRLSGGSLCIDGGVSSQYASALLMIAPMAGGMTLTLEGEVVSLPYIDMTVELMRRHGIAAHREGNTITVPSGHYTSEPLPIEGDWSAAAFWFALQVLLPQSSITLRGLRHDSLQGDSAIVELMSPLGVDATFGCDTVTLSTNVVSLPKFYERNMAANPDLVPTLAVTLCLLRVPFRLTGLQTLRIKESDRVEALRQELLRLGYKVECDDRNMCYNGNYTATGEVALDPHGDHRMAMALALAATRHPGIIIVDAEVVTKSYPHFWEELIGNSGKLG